MQRGRRCRVRPLRSARRSVPWGAADVGRPRFVRAELYEYRFTRLGDGSGAYWRRTRLGSYLDPVSLHSPALLRYLRAYGLLKR